MTQMEMNPTLGAEAWNAAVAQLPGAHVLQSWQWAQFKARYGWKMIPCLWRDSAGQARAAAMVLQRAAIGGLKVLYVPRGPLLDWEDQALRAQVLKDLQSMARRSGVIFVKIDPELVTGWGIPGMEDAREDPLGMNVLAGLEERGWKLSDNQVQFRNTVWLDLSGSEDDWLARMKQKTRYNLRLAERKGVTVRLGTAADLPTLYTMYAETSVRDGFVIREESYYLALWERFVEEGLADALVAEVDGEIVSGLMLFHFGQRAWYLYGMSRAAHRDKMPNYLLQWEAMRRAKAVGCKVYDLWGAPDVFDESDSMWGVFRFKEGLGGNVIRTLGAWDFTTRPLFYDLYTRVLPRILDGMRRRGKERTRQQVSV